mgnify:CR=1 FL=1
MTFVLPKLPYDYNALEPYIDEQTMRIHHTKHHQAYTDKFNAALEGHPELQKKTAEQLVKNMLDIPEAIRVAVHNHGGGFVNHSFFWQIMSPEKQSPADEVAKAINKTFVSFDKFKEQFSNAAAGVFGSGWAWLVLNGKQLEIMTTPNQTSPLNLDRTPLLGIDVWEHSYYIKYQNRRPEYIAAWWNVVNWEEVEKHFKSAMK